MLRFEIKPPDFTAVQRQLAHIPGAAGKAMSRAINKAITTAKTEAIRGAKERYTIQSDALKTGIRVVLSSPRRLSATLLATSSFQRIAKFKVKLTGRLVTSEIIRGRMAALVSCVGSRSSRRHTLRVVRKGKGVLRSRRREIRERKKACRNARYGSQYHRHAAQTAENSRSGYGFESADAGLLRDDGTNDGTGGRKTQRRARSSDRTLLVREGELI